MRISVGVDISKALEALETATGLVNQAIGKALYQGAEAVLLESQKEVPVRTGVLKSSGTAYPPVWDGHGWTQYVGYGGAATAYAWIVHENMVAKHAKGTKAKYLQDPFYRLLPDVLAHLEATVQAALA